MIKRAGVIRPDNFPCVVEGSFGILKALPEEEQEEEGEEIKTQHVGQKSVLVG